jgi:hypothetical protein
MGVVPFNSITLIKEMRPWPIYLYKPQQLHAKYQQLRRIISPRNTPSTLFFPNTFADLLSYNDGARNNLQAIISLIDSYSGGIAHLQLPPNDLICQPVSDLRAYQPIQRSGSESRIVAALGKPGANCQVDIESNASVIETSLEFLQTDIDDIAESGGRKTFEDDELVDSVEKFRGIVAVHYIHHRIPNLWRDISVWLFGVWVNEIVAH